MSGNLTGVAIDGLRNRVAATTRMDFRTAHRLSYFAVGKSTAIKKSKVRRPTESEDRESNKQNTSKSAQTTKVHRCQSRNYHEHDNVY